MNYLSHYYIDRFHPSPYYKLGVILPDLYRNFNAELKKSVFSTGIVWNSEHQALVDGVKKHYRIDSIFHNLPEFKEWMELLSSKMNKALLEGKYERRFFLVHIWIEFLLDRLLIMRDPDLLTRFYADMDKIDEKVIKEFFNCIDRQTEGSVFFSKFRWVMENKYLYLYNDNEMFTGALLNLYQRTVRSVIPAADKPALMDISLEVEQLLAPRLDALFSKLSSF